MVSAKRLPDNHNGWSGLPLSGLLCNFHSDDNDDDDGEEFEDGDNNHCNIIVQCSSYQSIEQHVK